MYAVSPSRISPAKQLDDPRQLPLTLSWDESAVNEKGNPVIIRPGIGKTGHGHGLIEPK